MRTRPVKATPGGNPPAVTVFQERVYAALRRVPRGRVTTYGALARALGVRGPRAVGQALRCNPFAPEVPCHRVIRSDLAIGGFAGETGGAEIRRKLRLLRAEGVVFRDGRLADAARLFRFGA
jgi:methylated-DNA-[protein]-cysteine S-methyltransferase